MMSKVNEILDDFGHEVVNNPEKSRTVLINPAKEQLLAEVLDIIGDGVPMFFGREYPVFKNLEEYTAHVAKIRQIQRDEMIKAAKERFK